MRRSRTTAPGGSPDRDRDPPIESCPKNGLLCSECGAPQYVTRSGETCASGDHGGVDGVTPEEWKRRTATTAKGILDAPAKEATGRRVTPAVWGEMKSQAADRNAGELAALDDGDTVSWTAGKETFCPVKFHGFEVGPVTVTTRVRPGETAMEAIDRARTVALVAWKAEYAEKLAGHLERIREAAGSARGARG